MNVFFDYPSLTVDKILAQQGYLKKGMKSSEAKAAFAKMYEERYGVKLNSGELEKEIRRFSAVSYSPDGGRALVGMGDPKGYIFEVYGEGSLGQAGYDNIFSFKEQGEEYMMYKKAGLNIPSVEWIVPYKMDEDGKVYSYEPSYTNRNDGETSCIASTPDGRCTDLLLFDSSISSKRADFLVNLEGLERSEISSLNPAFFANAPKGNVLDETFSDVKITVYYTPIVNSDDYYKDPSKIDRQVAMQGSAILVDPDGNPIRTLYYDLSAKQVREIAWDPEYPLWRTASSKDPNPLPYRTLAVHPSSSGISKDRWVYLDMGKDSSLTGYYYTADVGGGVEHNQVDIYVGAYPIGSVRTLSSVGITESSATVKMLKSGKQPLTMTAQK